MNDTIPNIWHARWPGHCPICQRKTFFHSNNDWYRDWLICESCEGGSLPRERALMVVLRSIFPAFTTLQVHESSPVSRGVSQVFSRNVPGYVATQFFPEFQTGRIINGVRNENLERQTFEPDRFDLVISQDVMEHVFRPDLAYQEIYRTLRPGGYYVHTTPIYKELVQSRQCASLLPDGSTFFHEEPEYHGNPVSDRGSLVTYKYGYDIANLIASWTHFTVEIRRFHDKWNGIIGEFTDVVVCHKHFPE